MAASKPTKSAASKSSKPVAKGKATVSKVAKIVRTRSKLDPNAKIKVLVTENPYRAASAKAKVFALIKTGMTVQGAIDKGVPSGRLNWAIKRAFIKVS